MILNFDVLDYKALQDSQWILAKGNLMQYLQNVKPTFFEYVIQRKIVKNRYLNSIINTVLAGEPVPTITLTTVSQITKDVKGETIQLEMEEIEILDGLQRTFRLWAYYKMIEEFNKKEHITSLDFAKKIRSDFPEFFDSGIITLTKIKEYYATDYFKTIENAFKTFEIYFIIWSGLSQKRVIHKMLVLNAGQRPVSLTHQYELLFLFVWEEISKSSAIKIFRERDANANKIKSGEREPGEYMFSSVIAGLRSFLQNKPKRISIDDFDIEDLQQAESEQSINEEIFSRPYIETFLNKLRELDEKICVVEKDEGKKWFARETTISGLLAGLGKYVSVKETMTIKEITELTNKAFDTLILKVESGGLMLSEFQEEYKNLQSRTVNVGTFLRSIIMDYIFHLLNESPKNWHSLFAKSKS